MVERRDKIRIIHRSLAFKIADAELGICPRIVCREDSVGKMSGVRSCLCVEQRPVCPFQSVVVCCLGNVRCDNRRILCQIARRVKGDTFDRRVWTVRVDECHLIVDFGRAITIELYLNIQAAVEDVGDRQHVGRCLIYDYRVRVGSTA